MKLYHDVHSVKHFNIPHTNVLSSSDGLYNFGFYFCESSLFVYRVFTDILYLNNVTSIFDKNLYITGLLNNDNKFLYCNCQVAGIPLDCFKNKISSKYTKNFLTLENNSFYLIITSTVFRFFSRNQKQKKQKNYVILMFSALQ